MFKFNVVSILHSFQHSFIYYDLWHCHNLMEKSLLWTRITIMISHHPCRKRLRVLTRLREPNRKRGRQSNLENARKYVCNTSSKNSFKIINSADNNKRVRAPVCESIGTLDKQTIMKVLLRHIKKIRTFFVLSPLIPKVLLIKTVPSANPLFRVQSRCDVNQQPRPLPLQHLQ